MRAVVMDRIGEPLKVREVPDPAAPAGGVVVVVLAARSDYQAGRVTEGELRAAGDRAAAENIEVQPSARIRMQAGVTG